jgi:hypothetical protein
MYVYLLKHKTEPIFKIGKAVNIHNRLAEIGGVRSYDLEASRCLHVGDGPRSYRLERKLHLMFEDWSTDELGSFDGNSGHSEMFRIECFDRVIRFIDDNKDLIGITPQAIPAPPEPTNTATFLSRSERKLQITQKRREDCYINNHQVFETTKKWVASCQERGLILERDDSTPNSRYISLYFKEGCFGPKYESILELMRLGFTYLSSFEGKWNGVGVYGLVPEFDKRGVLLFSNCKTRHTTDRGGELFAPFTQETSDLIIKAFPVGADRILTQVGQC